jgi:hypothetical protein
LPLDYLTDVIDSLSELKRMFQLNVELLEQLAVTCDWLKKNNVPIQNEETFNSLLNKTTSLLAEIQADEPKSIIYKKIEQTKFHMNPKTATDFTEPLRTSFGA